MLVCEITRWEALLTNNEDALKQQVFLLTSALTNQKGIGSIFLRDIIAAAPDLNVHWRVVPAFMLGAISTKTGLVWRAVIALAARMGVMNDLRLTIFRSWRLKSQADIIEREFRQSGADRIWVTTSSPELIFLALTLAQRGIDMRMTVLDDPDYLAQNLRLSKRSTAQILDHFRALLKLVRVCSVVSEGMKDEYAKQASELPIVFMRHGIAPRHASRSTKDAVRIVFAGSLYSKVEWNAFVTALESVNWRVAGRDIQLEFVGVFPLKGALRPKALVLYPPMSQADTLSLIATAHIGYLPYWMDPAKEFIARTSFPGKMTAYSAAGLAIFHHGPASSSVTTFLSRHIYGVACDSLQKPMILGQLEVLVSTMDDPKLHQARVAAMDQELSDASMMRGFRALMSDTALP